MGVDVRHLRPAELARLLNSTPLGEVIRPQAVYRHQNAAGLRIGDGRHIDLLKYAAWLFHARREALAAGKAEAPGLSGYELMKERARQRNADLSRSGRDIGPIPEVVDRPRRGAAEASFRRFCDSYFSQTFSMPWSDDHLKVIAKIEQAVLHGGLFAMAMPRGSGKTTLSARSPACGPSSSAPASSSA